MLLKEEREQVVEYGKQLLERNLSVGTFGNISIYNEKENLFAISPSGMDTIRQPLRMLLFAHRKEKKLKEQLSHQVN